MLATLKKTLSGIRGAFFRQAGTVAGPESPCRLLQTAPNAPGAGMGAPSNRTPGTALYGANSPPAGLARILRPAAALRWSLPMVASMTPQAVEMILRGAVSGDHVRQWELFDLMLDTWPELAAVYGELTEGVMARTIGWEACAGQGEAATAAATAKQQAVGTLLQRMAPDPLADENDFEGTIRDILDGWFRGVVMLETQWHAVATPAGTLLGPRCTSWAHPTFYAWGQDGRLGLRTAAGIVPPPPHRFITGIHKSRAGSPLGAAILRPLAWWWCAANFASDWLLNLAQLFGLPFRWANHDPNASQETVDAICNMLQNMGSAGWAAFPAGTTLELKDAGKSGDASPQGDLLDRADRYARTLILGQTLSGGADSSKGGGKAFGAVESEVKAARIDAAAKYVCAVVNSQLVPSIIAMNWGESSECPVMTLAPDDEAGATEAARDQILAGLMPIPEVYLQAKYNIPAPAAGESATTRHLAPAANPSVPSVGARLATISAIEDDALFAKELHALTAEL
jgi:phage gp29-like protein